MQREIPKKQPAGEMGLGIEPGTSRMQRHYTKLTRLQLNTQCVTEPYPKTKNTLKVQNALFRNVVITVKVFIQQDFNSFG